MTGLIAGLTMVFSRSAVGRLAADLTEIGPAHHVVDVGCGPGAVARVAAKRKATVTGVDPAPVMLGLARQLTRGKPSITWVEGTAASLPLPDASADVIWSIATVHHWPDVRAGLAEAQRVLVKGGTLLVIERRTRPGAKGLASHGWTHEQAAAFAESCRTEKFNRINIDCHRARRSTEFVVTALK